jgi:hypothetical protein
MLGWTNVGKTSAKGMVDSILREPAVTETLDGFDCSFFQKAYWWYELAKYAS